MRPFLRRHKEVLYAALIASTCLGASQCSKALRVDPSMHAALANDLTALVDGSDLQGCGTQLQTGLLFCRVSENHPAHAKITFVGPKSNCSRERCVFVKIYFPTGEPALELSIPKDQTSVSVTWRELIHADHFSKEQRGFWPFLRTVYWRNADGQEGVTQDEGLIYLRVLSSGYESLHESRDNPNWAFKSTYKGLAWRMTTSGRTYVEKRKDEAPVKSEEVLAP